MSRGLAGGSHRPARAISCFSGSAELCWRFIHALAEDATVKVIGSGFSGITLAQNVREKGEVAEILKVAEAAGGKIVKPAQDVFWGGHSGYFADPDGYLWDVAWNPYFMLNERGEVELP